MAYAYHPFAKDWQPHLPPSLTAAPRSNEQKLSPQKHQLYEAFRNFIDKKGRKFYIPDLPEIPDELHSIRQKIALVPKTGRDLTLGDILPLSHGEMQCLARHNLINSHTLTTTPLPELPAAIEDPYAILRGKKFIAELTVEEIDRFIPGVLWPTLQRFCRQKDTTATQLLRIEDLRSALAPEELIRNPSPHVFSSIFGAIFCGVINLIASLLLFTASLALYTMAFGLSLLVCTIGSPCLLAFIISDCYKRSCAETLTSVGKFLAGALLFPLFCAAYSLYTLGCGLYIGWLGGLTETFNIIVGKTAQDVFCPMFLDENFIVRLAEPFKSPAVWYTPPHSMVDVAATLPHSQSNGKPLDLAVIVELAPPLTSITKIDQSSPLLAPRSAPAATSTAPSNLTPLFI